MFNRLGKIVFLLAIISYIISFPSVLEKLPMIHPYVDSVALKIIAGIFLALALFGRIIGGFLIFIALGNLLVFFWLGATDFLKVQQSIFLFIVGVIGILTGSDVMNDRIANDYKRSRTCKACGGKKGKIDIGTGKYIACFECGGTGKSQY